MVRSVSERDSHLILTHPALFPLPPPPPSPTLIFFVSICLLPSSVLSIVAPSQLWLNAILNETVCLECTVEL
jgi:hypothetical protein